MGSIRKIYIKYKEVINYLIFGVLTTLVNFIVYLLFTRVFKLNELSSNCIAWVISVLFAYITNRNFVFNTNQDNKQNILREITSFFSSRVLTGVVCDILIFKFMLDVLHINDVIVKIIVQIIIIASNYLLSKFLVFKKGE